MLILPDGCEYRLNDSLVNRYSVTIQTMLVKFLDFVYDCQPCLWNYSLNAMSIHSSLCVTNHDLKLTESRLQATWKIFTRSQTLVTDRSLLHQPTFLLSIPKRFFKCASGKNTSWLRQKITYLYIFGLRSFTLEQYRDTRFFHTKLTRIQWVKNIAIVNERFWIVKPRRLYSVEWQ